VRGVIFDMDGVIVDSEHLWGESWSSFAAQHGRAWTDDDSRALQGMSTGEWAAALAARVDRPELVEEARRHCVGHYVAALERGEGPALDGARGSRRGGRPPVPRRAGVLGAPPRHRLRFLLARLPAA